MLQVSGETLCRGATWHTCTKVDGTRHIPTTLSHKRVTDRVLMISNPKKIPLRSAV
eukprot:m.696554 g.696554  ORF g.696554 m.696554 type:complete len:56 (+) comp22893_c0_seq12:1771-1938(+)